MSLKLSIFKALGGATLAGLAAATASKSAVRGKRKTGGCTPCAAAAALHKAHTAVRTGNAGKF